MRYSIHWKVSLWTCFWMRSHLPLLWLVFCYSNLTISSQFPLTGKCKLYLQQFLWLHQSRFWFPGEMYHAVHKHQNAAFCLLRRWLQRQMEAQAGRRSIPWSSSCCCPDKLNACLKEREMLKVRFLLSLIFRGAALIDVLWGHGWFPNLPFSVIGRNGKIHFHH